MSDDAKPARIELHQSHLNDFELCGEYYRLKHIEKQESYPGSAALRGGGVHGAAQLNYQQKIKTAKDLPKKQLVDAAVAAFEEKKSKEGFRLTPDERRMGASVVMARTVETVVVMTGAFSDQLAPQVQPFLTEKFIKAEIPGTNVDLAGTIDVVEVKDPKTGTHPIDDLKTSTRSKSQQDADGSNQFSQYGILWKAYSGEWPNPFNLDTIVDLKRGPKHDRKVTTRGPADYQAYINRLNVMLRAREAGVFAPSQPGHWFCSMKWCPFFEGKCAFVNSERFAASAEASE